jgi:hypothetical protein
MRYLLFNWLKAFQAARVIENNGKKGKGKGKGNKNSTSK